MPLTEEEKVSIRHHLGYLNVSQVQTFSLGVPAGVETQFLIEGAMSRVLEQSLPLCRRHLAILDALENQSIEDFELLAVEQLDTIKINQGEQKALDNRYDRWVSSLCNVLGVCRNPFDARKFNTSGGINVRVG